MAKQTCDQCLEKGPGRWDWQSLFQHFVMLVIGLGPITLAYYIDKWYLVSRSHYEYMHSFWGLLGTLLLILGPMFFMGSLAGHVVLLSEPSRRQKFWLWEHQMEKHNKSLEEIEYEEETKFIGRILGSQ